MKFFKSCLIILGLSMCATFLCADDLEEFKKEARSKERPKKEHSHSHSDDNDIGIFETIRGIGALFKGIYYIFIHASIVSAEKSFSEKPMVSNTKYLPRKNGDLNLVKAELLTHYFFGSDSVTAFDIDLELGLGPIAIEFRNTWFKDSDEEMDFMEGGVLLRTSLTDLIEVGYGFGFINLSDENESNSAFAFFLPIKVFVNPYVSLELKSLWSSIYQNEISDYDLSLSVGYKYVSGKVGYRWLYAENALIEGFYVGFSVRF
ncbi:MAG: hypothetical protein COA79_14150 [Planctomycetota bacterium]|nr:MAG: hypothetical protein COA79_14150 [Planctomycetota bacterium]